MKLRYLGHSCFELISSEGTKILTDPYTGVGYELPKGLTADVVTVSHGHFDHAYAQAIATEWVWTRTEEYAAQGVRIEGVECDHDPVGGRLRGSNIIFKITMDGMTFCHLGDVGERVSVELARQIGKVDVLLLPVGGKYTIDAEGAMEYATALAPRVVVPMHYKPKDGTLDITSCEPFLSLCGNYTTVKDGETEITKDTQGVIYMERVKQ